MDSEKDKKDKPNSTPSRPDAPAKTKDPETASSENSEVVDTGFMQEKIKQRPVNHRKLLRRTGITAGLAVLFGALACLTFLFLEPVISGWLTPEQEPAQVSFPEETQTEEMNPEDMVADDSELASSENSAVAASIDKDQLTSEVDAEVRRLLADKQDTDGVSDYRKLYSSLKDLANTAADSMVTVTGVTSETDWFSESYESSGKTSGLIIADSGGEILILAPLDEVRNAEQIKVTFSDSSQVKAQLKAEDAVTSIALVSVADSSVPASAKKKLKAAKLGSSASSGLTGSPVIAIGSPAGTNGSISYGSVTSSSAPIDAPDSQYKLITTDIYGSSDASGVLINLNGEVIGMIDLQYNSNDLSNIISAIGITELKPLIEKLSNSGNKPFLGVYGTDVPTEINAEQGVPLGAYVKKTEIDSPAMDAGLQSGDVITHFGGREITGYEDLVDAILSMNPGNTAELHLMRQGTDGYEEMSMAVTLGEETK